VGGVNDGDGWNLIQNKVKYKTGFSIWLRAKRKPSRERELLAGKKVQGLESEEITKKFWVKETGAEAPRAWVHCQQRRTVPYETGKERHPNVSSGGRGGELHKVYRRLAQRVRKRTHSGGFPEEGGLAVRLATKGNHDSEMIKTRRPNQALQSDGGTSTCRWPLIIDPKKGVKGRFKKCGLE